MVSEEDLSHLRRCVQLATEAFEAGNTPYGSMLVSADGEVLHEERNATGGGDRTRHPELAVARWAAANLSPGERSAATVYTSGEHCPMCAAAHALVGLGRVVFAVSKPQVTQWRAEWGAPAGPVAPLRITEVIVDADVDGPAPELTEALRELHHRAHLRDH